MPENQINSDSLDQFWSEKTDIIRTFVENQPKYKQLCEEIAFISEIRLKERTIEFAYITSRTKTLNSFIEKVWRKNYQNPLEEITDIAGVRIVFLYQSDRPLIEEIIESEFEIVEKVDKVKDQEADRFGYGALHYIVHLGQRFYNARYAELKDLICEIQVRTVLQDAWALVAHHLSYKQESEVPRIFRRKLNSISGLFETADDQFNHLKEEIGKYKIDLQSKELHDDEFLNQEINYDTLYEYLRKKYPETDPGPPQHLSILLTELHRSDYKKLSDLDIKINKTKKALEEVEKKLSEGRPVILHGVGKVRNSLSIIDDIYYENRITAIAKEKAIDRKNFRHFIKD